MSYELMDQHDVTASSRFFGENCSVSEGQVCEPKFEPDHQRTRHGMVAVPCSPLGSSSPIQKSLPNITQSVNHLEEPPSIMAWEKMERQILGTESASISNSLKQGSDSSIKSSSYNINGSKSLTSGMLHEASLFSSSLSEVFNRKLRLSGNDFKSNQHSSAFVSQSEEDLFESLEEVEVQTIGNLLPDEDDLFSGVTDELGCHVHGNSGDEFEDFDLFSSGGGMELGDDHLHIGNRNYEFVQGVSNGKWSCNGSIVGQHPSRTLFVRNINSNIEDSQLKALFQQYGDIWTLYMTCKHRGFVMITYYDIRAARNAMRALQNKPVMQRKLDIHYSIPKDNPSEKGIHQGILVVCNLDSSVSNDDLRKLFGLHGEIKKIREAPYKPHNKFIEFYDVRAAESALHALNKSEIGGKQIKLELALPGDARQSLMQVPDLEQDEPNIYHSPGGNLSSTLKVIASSCTVNSSSQGLYSTKLLPMNTLNQNSASGHSSSFPNTFPYPVGMTLSGEQFGICESNNSLEKIKFGNQFIPSFHPHSFPEHHDIQRNTSITLGSMATGGLGVSVVDNRLSGGSTNRHPMELNGRVFGSPANDSCPVPEHHYMLNKTNSYQQHHSSPMPWQNSPSFVNGLSSHCFPQIPGFPRTPPQTLGCASPLSHHIGSAPAVNPSLWDIHAYSGEHSEASSIHNGSLGGVGFPASPQFHPLDISSRNIISKVGQNCMGMTTNTVQHSSQHVAHIFPGRNEMISGLLDSLNERTRNPFPRRNDVNSSNTKQYELDIDRILRGEDSRTTLMIKNIPNKYTSKMILAAIDERCRGSYDFLYLPIDFKNKCNVGYAFINMIDPRQIATFYQAFNGKKWEKFNSEKVACLAYARIQGKTSLIAHFQNSSLMNEDQRCRPILFHTNGPNAGDPEPFPMGTNIRSRQGNPRMSINEENNNQGSPAETSRREETSEVSTDQTGQLETNHYI